MSDDLAAAIEQHVSQDEVIEICQRLVQAPSENPPGDEVAVADASQRLLKELGIDSQTVSPLPNRPSTIAEWGGIDGKTLLFNGHYDVVPATDLEDWPHPPYDAVVVGNRMIGRGTSDMKSGIACCLAAVSTLQKAGLDPKGKLVMHFVADEEALGTHGTKWLQDNGYCDGVTEALVGEPTSLHLVTSERGAAWLNIITEGKSAHGSTPQLGINAINHMAKVIDRISAIRFGKLHEVLGAPTINVGVIEGGAKVNSVADRCRIEVDRRTLPGETLDEVVGEIDSALDDLRADNPDLNVRVEVHDFAEASETPEGTSLVELLDEGRQTFGVEGSEIGYSGATDARFLINQGKIPSIVFGPGDVMVAHTTGEFVEIDKMVAATKIYARAMARFLEAS